jgi:hypothetical protein
MPRQVIYSAGQMRENALFYSASSIGDETLFKPSDRNEMAGACTHEKKH